MSLKSLKHFCAFRMSCHDLEIERRGGYGRKPKLAEERICKICNMHPETKEHFMLFCPVIIVNMMKLESIIIGIPHSKRYGYLANNKDNRIIREIITFLCKTYIFESWNTLWQITS